MADMAHWVHPSVQGGCPQITVSPTDICAKCPWLRPCGKAGEAPSDGRESQGGLGGGLCTRGLRWGPQTGRVVSGNSLDSDLSTTSAFHLKDFSKARRICAPFPSFLPTGTHTRGFVGSHLLCRAQPLAQMGTRDPKLSSQGREGPQAHGGWTHPGWGGDKPAGGQA